MNRFINREEELAALEEMWARRGAQFLAVYGRRRTGKTTLLLHFARDRPYLYWVASRLSSDALLRSFSRAVHNWAYPETPAGPDFTYGDWETALRQTASIARDQRLLIILDEYPYAADAESALSSILQNVWDHYLKNTQIFLALAGSHVGMMEREIGSYQAPLYGRATGRLLLNPLKFPAVRQLLHRYSAVQQVETYAILGGIPSYLELWDDQIPVMGNVERMLSSTSLFLFDPPYLLGDELSKPRNYAAILMAIASGKRTPTAIGQAAGIDGQVSSYLNTLRSLRLVDRQVPVTEAQPETSRRGRYIIADPYLRFYFRFLATNLELIEQGRTGLVLEEIERNLPAFVGQTAFEDLCRAWVIAKGDADQLPFVPRRVGRWWDRQAEVDVVAINERDQAILLGEAKWTSRPMSVENLEALNAKATRVVPDPNWAVHYTLFSRSGFTAGLQKRAADANVLLVDLASVVDL
ncbi:MAG: ATP-binding protein [Chloroflexi bacterium]|nr:ATP-binding protein [Chloroflexota bacterium]